MVFSVPEQKERDMSSLPRNHIFEISWISFFLLFLVKQKVSEFYKVIGASRTRDSGSFIRLDNKGSS